MFSFFILQAKPENLTAFLRVVKLVAEGKEMPDKALSSLAPVSTTKLEKPVECMVITKPSEYPMSFPKSLTSLQVSILLHVWFIMNL